MSDFAHLAVIWLCVYLSVIAAQKSKLTPVLYFLAFGCLFVNLGIVPEQSSEFIRGFSELGIVVIMFALGFEENPKTFVNSIKRTWGIAFFGALAPFVVAYGIAQAFWHDTSMSIMFGLAMTATAVSLTMVSLKGEGMQASPAATGIMTAAVLDDIASLALVAILVPMSNGDAPISVDSVALIIAKVILFFSIVSILGVWVFPRLDGGWFFKLPLIGRFSFSDLLNFEKGEHTTLAVLLLAVAVGLMAHEFGFHPAVGAYMAGLILRKEYFDCIKLGDESHYDNTKRIIDNVAFSWLGPIFFVQLGSKLIIHWDILIAVLPQTLALTFGIYFAQVISAGLAARFTAGFDVHNALLIGIGMVGRAELAFVVIDIAYVQHAIFTTEAFYTLMFTAFWLNVSVPLSIRAWKKRYGNTVGDQHL